MCVRVCVFLCIFLFKLVWFTLSSIKRCLVEKFSKTVFVCKDFLYNEWSFFFYFLDFPKLAFHFINAVPVSNTVAIWFSQSNLQFRDGSGQYVTISLHLHQYYSMEIVILISVCPIVHFDLYTLAVLFC